MQIPEHTSYDEDLLLRKYFRDVFQYQYLLDSFNKFLEQDISACLSARVYELRNGSTGYLKIKKIDQPQYDSGDRMQIPLTPEVALLEGRTYSVRVWVAVEITNKKGNLVGTDGATESMMFPLINIPIPIYSDYCYYSWVVSDNLKDELQLNPEGKVQTNPKGDFQTRPKDKIQIYPEGMEKTMTPENPGCYFIIGGFRNVVLLFEKSRFNQIFVHIDRDSPRRLPYAEQLSENPYTTSSTYLFMEEADNKTLYIGVSLGKFSLSEELETSQEDESDDGYVAPEKAQSKKKREPSINVIAVAYAIMLVMGKKMKKDEVAKKFETRLKEIIPSESFFACWTAFAGTLNHYKEMTESSIMNQIYEVTGINQEKNDSEKHYKLAVYFRDILFPNWHRADEKFDLEVLMTSRLLMCYIGKTKITDRNHWGTRGLYGPGPMLLSTFRRKYAGLVKAVQSAAGIINVNTVHDLAELIHVVDSVYGFADKFMSEFKPFDNKGSEKSFGGKKPQTSVRKAISIDVSPINTIDLRTMLTKTRNNAHKENPSFRNRSVEGSFWKFFCSFKVTENSKCGITKFLALLTTITVDEDPRKVIEVLLYKKFMGSVLVVKKYVKGNFDLPVTVNGLLIGFTNRKMGYDNIVKLKRFGAISRKSCIVMSTSGTLDIFVDAHRLMIPVVVVDKKTGYPKILSNPNWKKMSFKQLLEGGYIEYLDNYEIENPTITLAQTFASFKNYESKLKMMTDRLRSAEGDFIYQENLLYEIESIKKGRPNYVALHPMGSFGVTAALLPFQNHEQSCRTSYAEKMQGQVIHRMLDNPYEHFKNYATNVGTISTVDSFISNITAAERNTGGQTCTVAFYSTYMSQEDACIINRKAIDLGMFRYTRTIVIKDVLEEGQKYGRHITGELHPYHFRHIGSNGMPATNVYYGPGDYILGKYQEENTKGEGTPRIDKSIRLDRDEEGIVTEVVTYYSVKSRKNMAKRLTVSIRLVLYSRLQVGDKVTTRHSQKYIVSQIVNPEDMPFNDRTEVHVAFNPQCLPTRMTIGTVLELLIGRQTALTGKLQDIAGHKSYNATDIQELLVQHGYSYKGVETLFSGVTGEEITAQIYTGPQRVNMLAHIAAEKIQCRSMGKKNKVTGQAEAVNFGVAKNKGQKIGEPERNQLIKYGASFVISDRMNISCDGVTVVICKLCSSYAWYDKHVKGFQCPKCDISSLGKNRVPGKERFGKFIMPQTARYFQAGLATLGVHLKPKFVTAEEYLRTPEHISISSELDIAGEILTDIGAD
jgi:DNA-directed RNA polymerase beta subunit